MTFYLYLLHNYNNYFNRIVKKEERLEDYLNAVEDYFVCENVNFAIGDGVNTSHIINKTDTLEYDYCVVADSDFNILSRWFIKENIKTRNSQWNITLKRDVIVDFYEKTINAPLYLEKGFVSEDSVYSLIKEPIELNQIKTKETLIKDLVNKKGWVIIYKKTPFTNIGSNYSEPIPQEGLNCGLTLTQLSSETGIESEKLKQLLIGGGTISSLSNNSPTSISMDIGFANIPILSSYAKGTVNINNGNLEEPITGSSLYVMTKINKANYYGQCLFFDYDRHFREEQMYNGFMGEKVLTYMNGIRTNGALQIIISRALGNSNDLFVSQSQLKKLESYNGQEIVIDNITYILNFSSREEYKEFGYSLTSIDIESELYNKINTFDSRFTIQTANQFSVSGIFKTVLVSSTIKTQNAGWHFIAPASQEKVKGEPYYAMAIPVGQTLEIFRLNPDGFQYMRRYQNAEEYSKYLISQLLLGTNDEESGGSSDIIDAQWVPYFPLPEAISDRVQTHPLTKELRGYQSYKVPSENCGTFMCNVPGYTLSKIPYEDTEYYNRFSTFMIKENKFKFNIDLKLEMDDERKVVSNCELYRFVSPNYQSKFDFNLASNGNVDFLIIACTYKAYQPIIYIQPKFSGLYGENFNDDRGLVISGDFSLSSLNSQWKEFQLNNKMYDKIFSRDIQNLSFRQNQETIQQIFSSIGGVGAGTAGGAIAGSKFGPYGAIAGAAIGGTTGAIGGAVDLQMMGERHKENLDYSIDKYQFNLANIKAMPNIITKISALDSQFKIFPFIEYYTCSEEERGQFKNKMKYEGMTLGIISKLSNFISEEKHYFKGRLIRIEELGEDNHIACDIYNELLKGVYL